MPLAVRRVVGHCGFVWDAPIGLRGAEIRTHDFGQRKIVTWLDQFVPIESHEDSWVRRGMRMRLSTHFNCPDACACANIHDSNRLVLRNGRKV